MVEIRDHEMLCITILNVCIPFQYFNIPVESFSNSFYVTSPSITIVVLATQHYIHLTEFHLDISIKCTDIV